MSSLRKRKAKRKGHSKPKQVMYAYRDASGAKVLLSVAEAHKIGAEKKKEDAVKARLAADACYELAKREEEGSKSHATFTKQGDNHTRRAKRLDRLDYKVSKACLGMGMKKVSSK